MNKRSISAMVRLAAVIALLAVCGVSPSVAAEPEYEWKYGGIMSVVHPLTVGAQAFADKMAELTGGRVHITVYDNSSLGTIQEMVEGCDIGTIEFIDASMAYFSSYSSKFYAFNLPYLFYNIDVAYAFLDGPLGKEMKGPIGSSGVSVIGFFENGMRCITSNGSPIIAPADAAGRKIRTMSNKVHMTAFEKVGASPNPMAFSELFTALQQNVVDGQENPLLNIKDYSFYEVQEYLALTDHFYDINLVCVNTDLYNSVPADIRAAIDEAMVYATEVHRRESIKQNLEVLDFFKANSKMEIIPLTLEQKTAWRNAMEATYDDYREEIGADYLSQVIAEIEKLQTEYNDGKLNMSGWR